MATVAALSDLQIATLQYFVAAGGPVRVASLLKQHPGSQALGRASVSRMIRRLSKRGLVELIEKHGNRVSHERKAYVTDIAVTAAGVEAAKSHGAMMPDERVTLRGDVSVAVEPLRLVLDLESRGCRFERDGDDVTVCPRAKVTADERAALRRWKADVVAILDYEAPPVS